MYVEVNEQVILAAKIVLVVVSIVLVASILLQSGRSAGLGAITGGGNEGGASRRGKGADPMLAKATSVIAIVFYLVTLVIAYLVAHS